jgi:hypothetical protein
MDAYSRLAWPSMRCTSSGTSDSRGRPPPRPRPPRPRPRPRVRPPRLPRPRPPRPPRAEGESLSELQPPLSEASAAATAAARPRPRPRPLPRPRPRPCGQGWGLRRVTSGAPGFDRSWFAPMAAVATRRPRRCPGRARRPGPPGRTAHPPAAGLGRRLGRRRDVARACPHDIKGLRLVAGPPRGTHRGEQVVDAAAGGAEEAALAALLTRPRLILFGGLLEVVWGGWRVERQGAKGGLGQALRRELLHGCLWPRSPPHLGAAPRPWPTVPRPPPPPLPHLPDRSPSPTRRHPPRRCRGAASRLLRRARGGGVGSRARGAGACPRRPRAARSGRAGPLRARGRRGLRQQARSGGGVRRAPATGAQAGRRAALAPRRQRAGARARAQRRTARVTPRSPAPPDAHRCGVGRLAGRPERVARACGAAGAPDRAGGRGSAIWGP